MLKLWSRRANRPTQSSAFGIQPLEPRIVFDGTPNDPTNPVVEIQTDYGNIYIELFPDVAPATVENFLGYVSRGDYDGTFFHRHVSDFVLQGGGWSYDENSTPRTEHVTQQDPVVNEFNLSNLEWTVAMAKLGGDPNSATSEWFINLNNNSGNLDNQNGGFTVFGEVIGGRAAVAAIADLRIVNLGSGFETVPMTASFDPQGNTVHNEDLVVLHDVSLVFDPDLSLITDTVTSPAGSATGGNRTTVTITSEFDRALAYQQNAEGTGWTVVDLNLKTDTSGRTESPVTWVDPKDGRTYAAAISSTGLLLYKHLTGTTWESRDLNAEIANADRIDSSLAVFVGNGGAVYLVGLTAGGELMLFNQTGSSSGGNYTWTARNLSDTDLASRGQSTPAFTSPLSSYVTSWNGLNIVGLDAGGDIQAVWWAPGQPTWQVSNLSNITGADPLQGTVAPYLTTWGGINLTGTDAQGNVVVTWWLPSFGGKWAKTNLTELKSGPTFDPGSLATYVTPWGGTNILGRDQNGQVTVYWWAPTLGPGQWQVTVLSQFIDGAEVPTGPLTGFSSPSGTVNLFGAASDGELIRYWWKPGAQWQWENVTDKAVLS